VDRAVQELLELGRRQLDELLGEREHLPHPHADEPVAAFASLEGALVLAKLVRRTVRRQPLDEPVRGELCRHSSSYMGS
jgi:hypothetical protein